MPKIIIILLILSAVGYFLYSNVYNSKSYIDHDTVIKGNYRVEKNKDVVIVAGSKLTVEGDAVIDGKLECDKGPIYLEVKGNTQINGSVGCKRESEETSTKVGMGIVLITAGKVEFGNSANIVTNGHIQIADNLENIAKTEQDLDKIYEETLSDSDEGTMRIGPFISGSEGNKREPKKQGLNLNNLIPGADFIKTAQAADTKADVTLNGHWKIDPPPQGVKRLIFYINEKAKSIEINGSIEGPKGRDGKDIKEGCDINIPKTEEDDQKRGGHQTKDKDALVTRIRAGKVYLGEFTLKLGDGGRGGDAITNKDCYPKADAVAGDGGKSGNLKITAETEIIVKNKFTILPGKGGQGGNAVVYGKSGNSGDPAQDGAGVSARGGNGADNIVSLRSVGNVNGLDKVYVGSVIAGDGGDATANPGNGGNATGKNCYGGFKGASQAIAGKGGKASFTFPPVIRDTDDAFDRDGKKGKSTYNNAKDGNDNPSCNPTDKASGSSAKKSTSSTSTIIGYMSSPIGTTEVTILPQPGVKLSDYTPLKAEVIVGNKLVWQATINKSDCKETKSFPGCNVPGYKYDSAWDGLTFDMKVYDKDSILRASFSKKTSTPWRPSCTGSDCPAPFIQAPLP